MGGRDCASCVLSEDITLNKTCPDCGTPLSKCRLTGGKVCRSCSKDFVADGKI